MPERAGSMTIYALALVLCLSLCPQSAPAETESNEVKEYQLKAVLIYKFLLFVDWPEKLKQPFVFGVLGDNPFGDSLDEVFGKRKVKGLKVEMRKVRTLEDAAQCHVVFIARSDRHRLRKIVEQLAKPVLLLSDSPGLAEKGAHINFHENKQKKLGFEINVEAARKVGIRISSKLLKRSKIVSGDQ